MNGRTNSSGSSVNDLQIPLDPCTNLECVAGNAQVELTWTDPLNKYATPEGEVAEDPDQLVSVWHHTVVIRKVGSAPVGIDDGIVVVSSEVKNQYQSTAYVDTGLVNDTTYYYGVFAVNEDGVESEGLVSEGVTPKLGTPLSELAEGTIIRINENGAPVEFYLAKHNYEPDLNGPGRELLVRKNSCGLGVAADHTTREDYEESIQDRWMWNTYKSRLSDTVKTILGMTNIRVLEGNVVYGHKTVILDKSVFALSGTELGITQNDRFGWCGDKLPIADSIRATEPDDYSGNANAYHYWTRSYTMDDVGDDANCIVISIYRDGSIDVYECGQLPCAYRPAFTFPSTILIPPNLILDEDNLIN